MLDNVASEGSLDDEVGAAVLARDEERTLLAGTVELVEEHRIEATLLARQLQHVVPNGIARCRLAALAEVEAILGEETRVCLPGAGARKVLELGKGLHVYGEGLRKERKTDYKRKQRLLR